MGKLIAAWTGEGEYPPFVNISEGEGGEVVITSRAKGELIDGTRVCGVTCFPSSDACSGYCRGTAAKQQRHQYVQPGPTNRVVLPAEAWADIRAGVIADMGSVGG